MAHIGSLREFKFKQDVDDIRGANLYGKGNEKLGTVEDVIFDHATSRIQYLVVDTGGWLKSRSFLVPSDRVNAYDADDRDFTCNLTKDEVQTFPEYKDSVIRDESDWQSYEGRYNQALSTHGDVLHRPGTDRLITPDATDMPAASGEASADFTPTRMADPFGDPAPGSQKIHTRPSGTASRAEEAKFPGTSLGDRDAAWTDPDEQVRPQQNQPMRRAEDLRDGSASQSPRHEHEMHEHDVQQTRVPDHDVDAEVRQFSKREDMGDVDVHSATAQPNSFWDSMRSESAYGDPQRRAAPSGGRPNPPSYNEQVGNVDPNVHQSYPSHRLRDFEENLRKNKVDITASCRQCGVKKDDKAA